jgi:hypothetical protein
MRYATTVRSSFESSQLKLTHYRTTGSCYKGGGVAYGSVTASFQCNGSMADETVTAVRKFLGSGSASVSNGSQVGCWDNCRYTYAGDRSVTLKVPRPELKLEARDSVFDKVTMPDTIRFVASWSPTHLGSTELPACSRVVVEGGCLE